MLITLNMETVNIFKDNESYEKYKKIVIGFIRKNYPSTTDIDDDVSDIMIKIFLGVNTYDPQKTKFNTWVLNITKNHMIDKWRMYKNTQHVELNNISSVINNSCCFIDNYEASNTVNNLSTIISRSEYTLLNMKYIDGYELKEIEKEFNMNSGDAWSKIKKIKYKLNKNNSYSFT